MLKEHLAIRQQLGMNADTLYYLGRVIEPFRSSEKLAQLKNDVLDVRSLAKDAGFQSVSFYGVDEAQGEALKALNAMLGE